jgi:hypothetical protein
MEYSYLKILNKVTLSFSFSFNPDTRGRIGLYRISFNLDVLVPLNPLGSFAAQTLRSAQFCLLKMTATFGFIMGKKRRG